MANILKELQWKDLDNYRSTTIRKLMKEWVLRVLIRGKSRI